MEVTVPEVVSRSEMTGKSVDSRSANVAALRVVADPVLTDATEYAEVVLRAEGFPTLSAVHVPDDPVIAIPELATRTSVDPVGAEGSEELMLVELVTVAV